MQVNINETRLGGRYQRIFPTETITTSVSDGYVIYKKTYTRYLDLQTGTLIWVEDPMHNEEGFEKLDRSIVFESEKALDDNDKRNLKIVSRDLDDNIIPELPRQSLGSYPTIVPNTHVDKVLLTPEELREVLAWALEASHNEGFPDLNQYVKGKPDSAITKLIDVLGTLVYGPNNYIGPGKTGNTDGTLEEIVTTIPALSEADARARAHDIALSVTTNPVVDTVLPPAAQAAQVFRPYFIQELPVPANAYSHTAQQNLAKTGTIEQNPGPIYTYVDKTVPETVKKIISDPSSNDTYLNDISPDSRVMDSAYLTRNNLVTMRTGRDDQTLPHLIDMGYMDYSGLVYENDNASISILRFPQDLVLWNVVNKSAKASLTDGTLGTSIASALNSTDTFTGMLRTQTNTMSGQSNIILYQRAPRTDYGCYLTCAKLLAYEAYKATNHSGCSIDMNLRDTVLRSTSNVPPTFDCLFPNTTAINPNGLPVGFRIDALYMNANSLGEILLGQREFPPGWSLDQNEVAFVIVPPGLSNGAICYYTICHMEYPFFRSEALDSHCVQPNPAGAGVPTTSQAHNAEKFVIDGNLIPGPKTKICFVIPTANAWPGFAGLPIPEVVFNAVPVDVYPTLAAWLQAEYCNLGPTVSFGETLQTTMAYMDLTDWHCANVIVAALRSKFCSSNSLNVNGTAATSGYTIDGRRQPPVVVQLNLRDIQGLPAADQMRWMDACGRMIDWNCLGIQVNKTSVSVGRPAAGAINNRTPIPCSCELQDTNFLTKLAIRSKMFSKTTIGKGDINALTKVRPIKLNYMQRDVQQVMIQMFHNWAQSLGVSNRMMVSSTGLVIDRRRQFYTNLYAQLKTWQVAFAGYQFLRPQLPPERVPPNIVNAVLPFISWDAQLDSPLWIYDHSRWQGEKETFYDMTLTTTTVANKYGADLKWSAGPANNLNVYGIGVGGANCVRVIWHSDTVNRWTDNMKKSYALMRAVHLRNANPITQLITYTQVQSNGPTIGFFRPPVVSSCRAWLRWTSASADSSVYRQNVDFNTAWVPLHWSSEFEPVSGTPMTIITPNQVGTVIPIQNYSFTNLGSANFGLISQNCNLDSQLTAEDPF